MATQSVATVNVVVSTYDGIVVAADSRVTAQDQKKTRVASEFGEKVKQVGSHVAVTYSGAAYLYDNEADLRNIGSIVDQYKNNAGIQDTTRTNPRSVAVGLDSLLTAIYNKYQKGNFDRGLLKIVICGYDTANSRCIYTLLYPLTKKAEARPFDIYGLFDSVFASGVPGAFVEGQKDVWYRLILGYDPRLIEYKCSRDVPNITSDSLDSTTVDTIFNQEPLDLKELGYDIGFDKMTLQDAIDFAVFIVRATIEAQRFNQAAVQGVGGAIDIAVLTPGGLRWIQRKHLHGEGIAPGIGE
jgi:20S proteasome alpha/beta subunit